MTKERIINIVLFAMYTLLIGVMVVCHEQWFDEAQAWLIARDLSPLGIIYQMRYEGHPFLWHYILMPFAKLGFPYITMNIISALFCIVSAGILLKKAPFNWGMKAFILCSIPFIYYAFVGRSYCLAVFAVVLLSVFYKDRAKKPILYGTLICFLANTHVIMLGLAIMLICTEYLYEISFNRKDYSKDMLKKHYIGGIIGSIGILIMFIIAFIGSMNNPNALQSNISFLGMIESVRMSLVHIMGCLAINNILSVCFFISGIVFLIILFYEKNKKIFMIFFCSLSFIVTIDAVKYDLTTHTIIAVMLILIFTLWIFYEKNIQLNYKKIIIYVTAMIMIFSNISLSYDLVKSDLFNNYSASKDTAEFINNNIEEDAKFICVFDSTSASIIPHLNKKTKFFSVITEQDFSFVTFSHQREEKLTEIIKGVGLEKIERAIKLSDKPTYFIYVPGLIDEEISILKDENVFEEVYVNDTARKTKENYEILKVISYDF